MRWTQPMMREVAVEERMGLGLGPLDRFDPYALCAEHSIPVYSLSDFEQIPEAVAHFSLTRVQAWSAALIPDGTRRLIVENDHHSIERRRSSIAHELAHHLLEHDFDAVVLGEDHRRQFNPTQEKQALFLSGELLIPYAAAERMAFDGRTNAYASAAYGVSEQFAQMQLRGQRVRAMRAAAKFKGA